MARDELIASIKKGQKESILYSFKSKDPGLRNLGIIYAVKHQMVYNDVIDELRRLKKDDSMIFGACVYHFAEAALDILGIEEYKGDSPRTKHIIQMRMEF